MRYWRFRNFQTPQGMPFLDLLTADRVRTDLPAGDPQTLLDLIAGLLSSDPRQHEDIRNALMDREALGSTGLGRGVAIPHGRLADLGKPRAAFARVRAVSERIRTIDPAATAISAGMSDDFADAIAEGATHLRIGTAITGKRDPKG